MSQRNFNNSTTIGTLSAPAASSATTLTVSSFSGYPAAPFTITVDRNTATEEICLVTSAVSGTLTVTRGFDGTAAQAHSAGAAVEHTAGAIEYTEANAHVNATADVHGVTGVLVGAEGSQSLFDKTLVSPVLQADVTAGDASVAYIPPGAEVKNLYTGIGSDGATKFSVSSSGVVTGAGVNLTTLNSTVSGNGTRITALEALDDRGSALTGASACTPTTGWAQGPDPSYARNAGNKTAILMVAVNRTGANIVANASGNLANTTVATVPTAFRPLETVPLSTGPGGPMVNGILSTSGNVVLTTTVPNYTIATGTEITLGCPLYATV